MRNILVPLLTFVFAHALSAQWNADTLLRTPVCTQPSGHPIICASDSGSTLVCWPDSRNNGSIYCQRIDLYGYMQWVNNGTMVFDSLPIAPNDLASFPDGSGGAMIIFEDAGVNSSTEIRAQRIDRDGNLLWGADGIVVRGNIAFHLFEKLSAVLTPEGTLVLVWQHITQPNTIEAQKIDVDGNLLWGPNGVVVPSTSGEGAGDGIKLVADDSNGAFISWENNLSATAVEHLDANGNSLLPNTIVLTADQSSATRLDMTGDGAGGIYVAVDRNVVGAEYEIRLFHIASDGSSTFTNDGLVVAANRNTNYLKTITDGFGGVIICYMYLSPQYDRSAVQGFRFDISGNSLWGTAPVSLCTDTILGKENMMLASDSAGGAFIIWADKRYGYYTYYGQHIDGDANLLWRPNGYPVCAAHMHGSNFDDVHFDVFGKAGSPVVTWMDSRINNAPFKVYATDVLEAIPTDVPEPAVLGPELWLSPNPSSGYCTIGTGSLIGNGKLRLMSELGVTVWSAAFSGQSQNAVDFSDVPAGVYFLELMEGGRRGIERIVIAH